MLATAAAIAVLTGCGPSASAPASESPPADGVLPAKPMVDYQLGGAYTPAAGVNVVVRDRTAPAPGQGIFGVCYVNAFQTQPGEQDRWDRALVLRTPSGAEVRDPAWPDEALLDISTAANRAKIADVVGRWIDECAADGYRAVEFDNLDSFDRSPAARSLLKPAHAVAMAELLVARAHEAGLAAAQKNTAELTDELHDRAGFDFAIAEECGQWSGDCTAYSDAYGADVIDVEYTDAQDVPFATFCDEADRPAVVVLRDRDLVPSDDPAHVARWCE